MHACMYVRTYVYVCVSKYIYIYTVYFYIASSKALRRSACNHTNPFRVISDTIDLSLPLPPDLVLHLLQQDLMPFVEVQRPRTPKKRHILSSFCHDHIEF